MMVHLIIGSIISCGLLIFGSAGQKMLGAGKWTVLNVQPCARDEEMPWRLRIRRHKLNRSHDGFDVDFQVEDDLDDSCAVRLDICKVVDGGCKPYMIQKDDCFPNFVNKYAEENAKAVLAAIGMDPPVFPVRKGEYHMLNHIVDLEELPEDGIYGNFKVDGYIVKNNVDVACAQLSLKYEATDDDGATSSSYG